MSITQLLEQNRLRFLESLNTIQDKYNCGDDILLFQQNFNHIYKKVAFLFGTEDCSKYFETLMTNDRNKRQGFPSEIWLLIERIRTENNNYVPVKKEKDVWSII